MARGQKPAKIDEKGRLKIPADFRRDLEETYGKDLFITSITGECMRIYPMPVWLEVEKKLAALPSFNPTISRFKDRVNYYGAVASLDAQGRVLVHPLLRQVADLNAEVAVLGQHEYLDVWNRERFEAKLKAEPFTEEHQRALSSYGL